jgi:transposase-like protein
MPLRDKSVMERRQELVRLAGQDGVNRRELCRRFGISADTAIDGLAAGSAAMCSRAKLSARSVAPRHTSASGDGCGQSDGQYGIYLGAHEVASIELTKPTPVSRASEQVSGMSPH